MYVMQCAGGYPLPLKAGKFEILGFRATVSSTGSDARVTLVDDMTLAEGATVGAIYADGVGEKKNVIIDVRSLGGTVGNLEVMFPEPIKTRKGISISGWNNILAGTGMLYVR